MLFCFSPLFYKCLSYFALSQSKSRLSLLPINFGNLAMEVSLRCKETVSMWIFEAMKSFERGYFSTLAKKAAFACFTCLIALGGALVGTIVGSMKGQTTETGFLRGAGVGAVQGAITAIQLVESVDDGEPKLSKVALLYSLVNGKIFIEWVIPAVLKAYQWQISASETTYSEISDIYDTNGVRGLSQDCIQKIPENTFKSSHHALQQCEEFSCAICLEDFKDGDVMRQLPKCGHFFHSQCLDAWLARNGCCPTCRNYVCVDANAL